METFYFTYGSEEQPYCGGWTAVEAESMEQACELFRCIHPNKDGFLDCAGCYTEKEFMATKMPTKGNLGAFMRESITYKKINTD
jgi:hypothetical protein